jgi:2',3'-cyclic-nucleotide 2'-phosphodiesterase (5'-nucleotidase family)
LLFNLLLNDDEVLLDHPLSLIMFCNVHVHTLQVLRIVHINDVYELDNLPRLKTLVERCSVGCPNLITTLAGDFLAPSCLSSLDSGKGMIKVMNSIPITHVCFGNHENDVPLTA